MAEAPIPLQDLNPASASTTTSSAPAITVSSSSVDDQTACAWTKIRKLKTDPDYGASVLTQLKNSDWKTAVKQYVTENDVISLYNSRRSLDKPTWSGFLLSVSAVIGTKAGYLAADVEGLQTAAVVISGCSVGLGAACMKDAWEKSKHIGPGPVLEALTDVASSFDEDSAKWTATQKTEWSNDEPRVHKLEGLEGYLSSLASQAGYTNV